MWQTSMLQKDLSLLLAKLPYINELGYRYYFAQVTLQDQTVYNNVVLLDKNTYLQHWEALPYNATIKLEDILQVEPPPYCLTTVIAQQIFDQIEEVNDNRIFYLNLKNGKLLQCQTGFIPCFLEMPTGYSTLDVASLEKVDSMFSHQKRADFHIKSLEYFWCYY